MFLTSEQTGGPLIFSLRQHNRYLALEGGLGGEIRAFDIGQLAEALGQGLPLSAGTQAGAALQAGAGETWQEHRALILLACMDGKLFEWLNSGGEQCQSVST